MKKILFSVLALSFLGFVFTSCERDWIYPSDNDIQEAILGTWKVLDVSGVEITDNATRVTFYDNGRARYSASAYDKGYWIDTTVVYHLNNHIITFDGVPAEMNVTFLKDGDIEFVNASGKAGILKKVTFDYSQDIIGLWEGVSQTSPTYGNEEHAWEYRQNGAYLYYIKDGETFFPQEQLGRYFVHGDLLAHHWVKAVENIPYFENWILRIKNGEMDWTATRVDQNGHQYTSTFEMKEFTKPALAVILKEGSIDFWRQIMSAIRTEGHADGFFPVIFTANSDGDALSQLMAIESLKRYKANFRGIIIAPVWSATDHRVEQAVADYVTSHNDIPVVIIDTPIDIATSPLKDIFRTYVGTDNFSGGKKLAGKVSADAEDILTCFKTTSSSALLRSQGFASVKGENVGSWSVTNTEDVRDILSHVGSAKNVVLFNGDLFDVAAPALTGFNVYVFDAFKNSIENLRNGGCVKGILAQNTFLMGAEAVRAVMNANVPKNVNIPVIYVTRETVDTDEDFKEFIIFYGTK